MGNLQNIKEQYVSNNQFWRNISNKLDSFMKWEGDTKNSSKVRRVMHGTSHWLMGVGKKLYGNKIGAEAEFRRARDQFNMKKKLHHHGQAKVSSNNILAN